MRSGTNRIKRIGISRHVAALTITGTGILALAGLEASGASTMLESANVSGFHGALVTSAHRTLYLLSNEKGAKIHCSASCLRFWPPMLVKDSLTRVSLGANVTGHIGFVARGKTMKQVTFNSYPLYRYAGDSAALVANGEGLVSYGGTWFVVNAHSTTPAQTAMTRKTSAAQGGSSATTGSTTTTVGSYGGGTW